MELKSEECFFTQGCPADCVYCLKEGCVKVTVVSPNGKQGTIALLSPGDLFGEEALANPPGPRSATATAVHPCAALKIGSAEMLHVMHQQPGFCDRFVSYLLARKLRTQDDLLDFMFNSSAKRLARTLLLMAQAGRPDEPKAMLPPITQETLAEMIGTTRSRVSFFMNRFRDLGLISYRNRIHVHKPRLEAVLVGQMPELVRETSLVA